MAFTAAEVNTWFQTLNGLSTTQVVPTTFLDAYLAELNATPPTATQDDILHNLKNFPFNSSGTGNVETTTFYRTTVAQFVLREFQAAWGVVPTATGAGSQYDNWVARILSDPTVQSGTNPATSMSVALAGTPQFALEYGIGGPGHANDLATTGFLNLLWHNLGFTGPTGAGLLLNAGVSTVSQVLQSVVTSQFVINNMYPAVTNFQDVLFSGTNVPGSLFIQPGSPNATLTLTAGVDTPTTGFSTGSGATATSAGAVFTANPVNNPPFGVTNSLNIGDNLQATGAAAGDSTLNYTAVGGLTGNPPDPVDITMNGVSAAIINNVSGVLAGFSGNITGLTSATVAGGDLGNVRLGVAGNGLNTALTSVTINANHNFTGIMTAAALAGAPTGTIHLNGVTTTVELDNDAGGLAGYGKLIVDSGGAALNTLALNAATPEIDIAAPTAPATTTEALVISGAALDIATLHTFTGTAATGDLTVVFNHHGTVAATGGAGDDRFVFDTPDGLATFPGSSVNGEAGTNTLVIQADTGAILVATDGPNITNINTVENTTTAGGATGALTADLTGLNAATVFDLAGAYGAHTISVTDITNAQTVEFSGTGGHLTLVHTAPLGLDSEINLQLSGGATTDLTQLTVAPGLASLNVHGVDGGGTITNFSTVQDNVNVDGASPVELGTSFAGGFTHLDPLVPLGGEIDASTDTGGVETWLPHLSGANALVNTITGNVGWVQTFIGGTAGADLVNVQQFGGDLIDFSAGGPGTAQYNIANFDSAHFLANPPPFQYNQVNGFGATDAINVVSAAPLTSSGTGVSFTNGSGLVGTGAAAPATNTFDFTTDTVLANATIDPFNFIKIDPPIPVTTGSSVQVGFAEAMGTVGSITVGGGAHAYLTSFYDTNTGEAVIGAVHATGLIVAADHIDVIALVHMSAATYAGFTPHFA